MEQVFRLLSVVAILTNAVLLVFVGTEATADAAALTYRRHRRHQEPAARLSVRTLLRAVEKELSNPDC